MADLPSVMKRGQQGWLPGRWKDASLTAEGMEWPDDCRDTSALIDVTIGVVPWPSHPTHTRGVVHANACLLSPTLIFATGAAVFRPETGRCRRCRTTLAADGVEGHRVAGNRRPLGSPSKRSKFFSATQVEPIIRDHWRFLYESRSPPDTSDGLTPRGACDKVGPQRNAGARAAPLLGRPACGCAGGREAEGRWRRSR